MNKTKFCITATAQDGKAKIIELTLEEYLAFERAMQWPEDLAAWDRLNTPINGSELGIPL
jgi:hypothetical protein